MTNSAQINEALALALKLSPKERIRLIEEVASSVERELDATPTEQQPVEHWGKALNALLDQLDMSDWEALDIDDPVEWVKQLRDEEMRHRLGDWGTDQ